MADQVDDTVWAATRPRAMTASEVAERLSIHVGTVKRIPTTELPYFTVGDRGDRRYEPADVERYVERKRRS